MLHALKNIKNIKLLPWVATIPLIIAGFAYSVFFTGTNSINFAPGLLSLLLFACFAMFPNLLKQLQLPKGNLAIMLGLYALYIIASVGWSTVPYLSTQFMFFFCIIPFIFIVMIQTDDMFQWTRIHAAALLTVFAGLAVWAMIQYIFLFDVTDKRIHHPMLNPNSLAGLFNMSLLAALALFVWAKKRIHMIAGGVLLALLYAGLIVTQSRAGIVFEAISVLVFLTVMWRFPSLTMKKLAVIVAIAVIVPFVLDLVHTTALDKNLTKWAHESTYSSMNDRYALMSGTWDMVKAHPWFGTGLSTFYFYYPRYRLPYDRSDGFFTHIDPLQFWAEMGIAAPIMFYGILILVLLRTIKAMKATPKDSNLRLEIMAPFCGLLAILMHAHMTFHLYILAMLFPIAFLFAYWYAATEKALGLERTIITYDTKFKKYVVVGVVSAVLLLSAQWITRAAITVSLTNEAAAYMQKGKFSDARDTLDFASKIGPKNAYRIHQLQENIVINMLVSQGDKLSSVEQKALYEEAILHLDRAQKYAKPFGVLDSDRAKLYYIMPDEIVPDGFEKAEPILLAALENNPMLWDARVGLARMYKLQGYLQKSFDTLNAGREWPMPKGQFMVEVLLEMARLQQQMGNTDAAQKILQEAGYWNQRYGTPPRGR